MGGAALLCEGGWEVQLCCDVGGWEVQFCCDEGGWEVQLYCVKGGGRCSFAVM